MKRSARKKRIMGSGEKLLQPRTEWVKMKGQLANVLRKEKGKEEDLENTEEKLGTMEDRNRSLRK